MSLPAGGLLLYLALSPCLGKERVARGVTVTQQHLHAWQFHVVASLATSETTDILQAGEFKSWLA